MKLFTIDTELFKLDGGAMFGVVPKSIWNKLNPSDENNLCTWAMRCLLIQEEDRLILIDTGIGNKQEQKFLQHYYLHGNDTLEKSLQNHGFVVEDITDVILTHLHFDHCGGAIKKVDNEYVLTFPNATYWSNEMHWQWATNPNDREKASFLPENIFPIKGSGKLQFIPVVEKNLVAFTSNISIRFVSGHTKAMMLPQIKYKNKTIVFMADLLPAAAHIPLPYVMAYDMFPLTTLQEKQQFLEEALENDYILFFEHDPIIECCSLKRTDRGIRMSESFRLIDI
ncbi:MAG: MBL fold metallo-hydrolase [Chitinophagaceae bacterium]|nr:MBL fold metallo-hydrolase [Chitinophagaceae bacterium]